MSSEEEPVVEGGGQGYPIHDGAQQQSEQVTQTCHLFCCYNLSERESEYAYGASQYRSILDT